MFLSTTDFGKIRADMEPSEIVQFINSTVNAYDKVVQGYSRVYKVNSFERVFKIKIFLKKRWILLIG